MPPEITFVHRGAKIDAARDHLPAGVRAVRDFLDKAKLGELWHARDLEHELNRPSLVHATAHPALKDYRAPQVNYSNRNVWGSRETIAAYRRQFLKK